MKAYRLANFETRSRHAMHDRLDCDNGDRSAVKRLEYFPHQIRLMAESILPMTVLAEGI
ncbi:hypothetical protein [Paraburkholderia sp. XV]|uniref:hypothetical protein n=1 Tax=Paraburkholderia sp. XV TaxID=2831520 RepID=UPI001CD7C360|nr:hypothetical protein [Paraburkholderia sp. XV]